MVPASRRDAHRPSHRAPGRCLLPHRTSVRLSVRGTAGRRFAAHAARMRGLFTAVQQGLLSGSMGKKEAAVALDALAPALLSKNAIVRRERHRATERGLRQTKGAEAAATLPGITACLAHRLPQCRAVQDARWMCWRACIVF